MQLHKFYADYIAEREGASVIELEHGFAIYKLLEDSIYLQDIYVQPDHRKSGVGTQLLLEVENIGKKANKSTILGTTDLSARAPEQSMLSILHSGFKVQGVNGTVIWFSKSLKDL